MANCFTNRLNAEPREAHRAGSGWVRRLKDAMVVAGAGVLQTEERHCRKVQPRNPAR